MNVTVAIPTFRRPKGLRRAVESALAQTVPVSVLVVDNDPAGSARGYCEGVAGVRYIHEPRAGVSHARNTALRAVDTRYMFFLDDDMRAGPGCVEALLKALDHWQAGVASAAVTAVMPTGSPFEAAMQPFFSRDRDEPEGPTERYLGAGGTLFDLDLCPMPSPAFDPDLNETGGEDDRLLGHLHNEGVTLLWVPSARTEEDVPARRATLGYVWTRNFAFGQGPTQGAADEALDGGLFAWAGVAKWMTVGMVQTVLRLPAWLLTRAAKSPAHVTAHARLAQGLGKVFWWGGFKPRLYGAAMLA